MNSVEEVLTRVAFWVQAGHVHSGMDSIAMEGASNVNVPPWSMGSLEKKDVKKASGGRRFLDRPYKKKEKKETFLSSPPLQSL